ncbi:MAG: threonine synthase [Deltaproteobacteria bacterium]|nr:threonine synthase [Deltaproteobacteria bacterium]MBW1960380.1 threonine synthase [Deltaproteobacteria bacterium]MBW1993069.1 threonine synthase [Deltaproteobacteria bacterium]MBW2151638.1 threonine synthase [Deltaproteobacteria bacterium]
MKINDFPENVRSHLVPKTQGNLVYRCLGCQKKYGIDRLLYTCPNCHQVLLIDDECFGRLKKIPAKTWHQIFDYRKMLTVPALKGIFRYYEFIGPVLPLSAIVYLGEGNTPVVEANRNLQEKIGLRFYFKNEGQNPSASFKDRGMASALSYFHFLLNTGKVSELLTVCASSGDTSASAALYAAYLSPRVKSAVLLPRGKVTPQQLSQPLGNGATVFEIPGVFDDCMKVVETLVDNYSVALLNSKNAWRLLGQESYSYEIAQDFEYEMEDKVVVVPVGNAGNITAIMNGFLKFYDAGIINALPKIIGVQSSHANPVYKYYSEPIIEKRKFVPVAVKPSVAQAAMIGNPVSMPRVIHLTERYNHSAGQQKVFFVEVTEQAIMDFQLMANRNGHIACTHGGESLAGLVCAMKSGFVEKSDVAILNSTAHVLKFLGFQEMYFTNKFPPDFEIKPNPELINSPIRFEQKNLTRALKPGKPTEGEAFVQFIKRVSDKIASHMKLKRV